MSQIFDITLGRWRPLTTADLAGGGGGNGGTSVTNLTATVSPTSVVVVSDTGTDATIPLADSTNAGVMTPEAVVQLAGLGSAAEADVADFATANHTHALLMTTDERTKLTALPAAADLSTSLAGKMPNTMTGLQTVINDGTPTEKAALQSSVSGDLVLSATNAAANSAALSAATALDLPAGTYPINPISLSTDIVWRGKGKTKTVLTCASDTAGWLVQSSGKIDIEGVGFTGAASTMSGQQATAGGMGCVLLSTIRESRFVNNAVRCFGATGVGLFGDSSANDAGPEVSGNTIDHCFVGIDSGVQSLSGRGEYCKIASNTILECRNGYICNSGNNTFAHNSLQYNGYGAIVDGAVTNGAHGVISNNLINHSYIRSLWVRDVLYGHAITSNAFYSSTADIVISDSVGVMVRDNVIYASAITCSGTRHHEVTENFIYGTPVVSVTGSGPLLADNWAANYSTWLPGGRKLYQLPSGPDLVTNGGFDADASWTKGAGWTISGGVATRDGAAGTSYIVQAQKLRPHTSYSVTLTVTRTAGTWAVGGGGNVISVTGQTAVGTVVVVINTGTGADGNLYIGGTAFAGTIDNVSVKVMSVDGNFQSQLIGAREYLYVGNCRIYSSTGSPEGVVSAPVGSEYTREDGTAGTPSVPGTLKYIKTSGSGATGWTATL